MDISFTESANRIIAAAIKPIPIPSWIIPFWLSDISLTATPIPSKRPVTPIRPTAISAGSIVLISFNAIANINKAADSIVKPTAIPINFLGLTSILLRSAIAVSNWPIPTVNAPREIAICSGSIVDNRRMDRARTPKAIAIFISASAFRLNSIPLSTPVTPSKASVASFIKLPPANRLNPSLMNFLIKRSKPANRPVFIAVRTLSKLLEEKASPRPPPTPDSASFIPEITLFTKRPIEPNTDPIFPRMSPNVLATSIRASNIALRPSKEPLAPAAIPSFPALAPEVNKPNRVSLNLPRASMVGSRSMPETKSEMLVLSSLNQLIAGVRSMLEIKSDMVVLSSLNQSMIGVMLSALI